MSDCYMKHSQRPPLQPLERPPPSRPPLERPSRALKGGAAAWSAYSWIRAA